MANLNSVVVVGRLTRDCEMKYTADGKALASFSVAVDSYKKDNADFFEVTVWGKTAEVISKYLVKGKQIGLSGRLKQDRWQDTDGKQRSKITIVAENIQLLGGGNET